MRHFYSILTLLLVGLLSAQNNEPEIDFDSPDSLYREDQFYIGLSYSNMQNAPSGFDQLKISPNVFFGFLRDMPINKSRTWAIGAGLGYRISVMNHNLGIPENGNSESYNLLLHRSNCYGDLTTYQLLVFQCMCTLYTQNVWMSTKNPCGLRV